MKAKKALSSGVWMFRSTFITILLVASALQSQAQSYPISQAPGSLLINLSGPSAGVSDWMVNGVNQLMQQWYYFSVDGGTVHSLDNLGLISSSETTSGNNTTVYADYGNSVIQVQVNSTLKPGNGAQSILSTSFTLYDPDSVQHTYSFYQYSDFDLGGGSGNQSAKWTLTGFPRVTQSDTTGDSLVGTMTAVSGGTGDAEFVQAGLYDGMQFGITNGAPIAPTLNNTLTAGPGNVNFAYQANGTLAAGASGLSFIETETVTVPEPSTAAWTFTGMLILGLNHVRKLASSKKVVKKASL
jgi:hypothetical protein